MISAGQMDIQRARRAQQAVLQTAVTAGLDLEAPMKLAVLENRIAEGEFAANVDDPIELTDTEKTQFINESRNS
jgi:hypothetical protein